MIYDHIMVRFGELSTKGRNKKDFIRMLADNIKHALKDYPNLTYDVLYDHIYVNLNNLDYEPIINILKDIKKDYQKNFGDQSDIIELTIIADE